MLFKYITLLQACALATCLANSDQSPEQYFIRSCSSSENLVLRVFPSDKPILTLEKPILNCQSFAPCLMHFDDIKMDKNNSVMLAQVDVMGYSNETASAVKIFEMIVGWDMCTGKKLFQEQFKVNDKIYVPTITLCAIKVSDDGHNIFASYRADNEDKDSIVLIGWNKKTGKKIFQEEQGRFACGSENIRFTKKNKVFIYNELGKIHKVFDIKTNKYLTGLNGKFIVTSKNFANDVKKTAEGIAELAGMTTLLIYCKIKGEKLHFGQ